MNCHSTTNYSTNISLHIFPWTGDWGSVSYLHFSLILKKFDDFKLTYYNDHIFFPKFPFQTCKKSYVLSLSIYLSTKYVTLVRVKNVQALFAWLFSLHKKYNHLIDEKTELMTCTFLSYHHEVVDCFKVSGSHTIDLWSLLS